MTRIVTLLSITLLLTVFIGWSNTLSNNHIGNIINGGYAVEDSEWVYFSNGEDDGGTSTCKLYKFNRINYKIYKICDDKAKYLNLIGEFIYYSNRNDNPNLSGKLYRIRTDGNDREMVLNDDCSFTVFYNGFIYYVNNYRKLYKVDLNGQQRTEICKDKCAYINIHDDWIYYSNISENYSLYRIGTDGFSRSRIITDECYFLNLVDDHIYYINGSDNNCIYKINKDGSNKIRICKDACSNLNYYNGWLYYTNHSDNETMYKIRYDGKYRIRLLNNRVNNINVTSDWIFYDNVFDHYEEQYMTTLEGTMNRKITVPK